jgi:hypothetical protein
MIFHYHMQVSVRIFMVKIAASEHLKMVTGRIFRINKYGT